MGILFLRTLGYLNMKMSIAKQKVLDSCKAMANNNLRGYRGFTLTEIMMVMLIAGILAATALPSVFPGGMTARRAASVIVSDINFTRVEAMSKNRPFSLSSTTSPSYSYGDGHTRDLQKLGTSLSLTGMPITFNSLGEPVGITAPLTISVRDSTESILIGIAPYTGRVTLQ